MAHALQYKKEYCDMLVKHMSQGYSFSTFSAVINVSRTALYDWVEKYPEFKDAKIRAEDKAKSFLETRLMAKIAGQDLSKKGIDTKKIDTACLIFALKTRFYKEYGDRSKIEQTTDATINVVSLDKDDQEL
jgi:predicted DNA-binding protein YlxM (UPF0122 family)